MKSEHFVSCLVLMCMCSCIPLVIGNEVKKSLTFQPVSEYAPIKCPWPFGSYPDPTNCDRFYVCVFSKPSLKSCPPFTKFDKFRSKCVSWLVAVCDDSEVGTTEDIRVVTPPDTSTPTVDTFSCPSIVGVFLHPTDCSKYYVCALFIPTAVSCPQGHLFEGVKKQCKPADEVHCGSRLRPSDYTSGTSHTSSRTRPTSGSTSPSSRRHSHSTSSRTSPTSNRSSPTSSRTSPTSSRTRPTSSRTSPTSSRTRPTSSRTSPTSSRTRPTSSRTSPTSSRTRPTSSRTSPTSSRTRPTSSRTSPTSSRTRPTSSRTSPTSSRTRPTSSHTLSSHTHSATSPTSPSKFYSLSSSPVSNENENEYSTVRSTTEFRRTKATAPPETKCHKDDLDCLIEGEGDPDDWFSCPDHIGSYPHPTSRRMFIFCMNWKPSVKKCGQDLVFSTKLRTCVSPSRENHK